MNCNQKRSKILKAATVYLGQGRKHIEHFGKSGGIQSCRTQDVDLFSEEASEDERLPVVQRSSLLGERPFFPVGRAVGTRFPAELAGNSDRKETSKRVDGVYVNDQSLQEQHGKFQIKQDTKDEVEILGCPDSEGVRTDPDEQATECSSSFGYTDSSEAVGASDGQEVQSAPRDGNGALPSAVEDVEASDRRRKALNMDWKNYRRGIEWRCRWLDLRLVELQQRATNYDQVLSNIQQKKRWETTRQASTSAVRACPLPDEHASQPVLHRQRRRKVEETADVTTYMTKHPLFSRYEKKKREPESLQGDEKQQDSPQKDPNNLMELARVKQEESDVDEAVPTSEPGDQDSIEQIMWKVETLQARVIRLRNQLKGSTSHKLAGQFARGTTRTQTPKATARPTRSLAGALISSPATSKGSHGLRRRASDYDINNVVMSVSVGSKYVEHVRHVNIETPQWRFVDKVDRSELIGNSSDEDTDDETYKIRHGPLEIRERQNRYVPRSNKKGPDGGVASSSKSNLGRGEKILGAQTTPQCSISAQLNVKDES